MVNDHVMWLTYTCFVHTLHGGEYPIECKVQEQLADGAYGQELNTVQSPDEFVLNIDRVCSEY